MSLLHEEPEAPLSAHLREFDDSRVRLSVRSRIVDRLIEETGGTSGTRRITVVRAPAGFGKTRTVLSWLGDGSDPEDRVRWVNCPPPQTAGTPEFWPLLARELGAAASEHPSFTDASTFIEQTEAYTEQLVTHLTAPLILVIDDYHHATSTENDIGLAHLAAASPLLTLVVVGRRVSLLDRTVISARTRVRLIGPDDLALTAPEAHELAGSLRVPASDALNTALEQANGWPLAIRAALNLGSDELYEGPSNHRIWNAHADPVRFDPITNLEAFALDSLKLLPKYSGRVLLAASVLDAIGLDQMQRALGLTPEAALTATHQLLELGLLVEDETAETTDYRCHKAVRTPLRAFAVRTIDPQRLRDLYRERATAVAPTAPFTAFRLFCAAEEFTAAEILLARNFTTITDETEVCAQVLSTLPEAVLTAHPTLVAGLLFLETPRTSVAPSTIGYLTTLWAQGLQQQLPDAFAASTNPIHLPLICQAMVAARLTGDFDRSAALMQYLEGRLTANSIDASSLEGPRSAMNLVGSLPTYFRETASTALMFGDLAHTRRSLGRLRHHSERMIAKPWRGFPYGSTRRVTDVESGQRWMLVALGELAFTEMLDGNMHRCAELLVELDSWAATTGAQAPGISWVGSEIARAHLSYELGDESLLRRAVSRLAPIIDRLEPWQLLLIAEGASLRNTHGAEWALAHLDSSLQSSTFALQAHSKWSEYLTAFRVMLCTSIGDLARAQQLLSACPPESSRVRLERARLALFSGDDVDALLWAQQIGDPGTTARQRMDRSLIIATAAWNCGRRDEAVQSLGRAAALLQQHAIPSVLLNVPYDPLSEVVAAARAAGICDLVALIESIPAPARSRRYERLTEMELRTLAAIAEHRNANQAASALFITAGTVKKHLASVYRKLRVGGRDEAILQAGRMGLLVQVPSAE